MSDGSSGDVDGKFSKCLSGVQEMLMGSSVNV